MSHGNLNDKNPSAGIWTWGEGKRENKEACISEAWIIFDQCPPKVKVTWES